jgi:hypothetical protein
MAIPKEYRLQNSDGYQSYGFIPTWEYSYETPPDNFIARMERLNKLGEEGWELATSETINNKITYIFKRPTPPEDSAYWSKFKPKTLPGEII